MNSFEDMEYIESALELTQELSQYNYKNGLNSRYYKGRQRVRNLNIAVPPMLKSSIDSAVGWAAIGVDTLAERIVFQGWDSLDGEKAKFLSDTYEENSLDSLTDMVHRDALVYGTSFMAVTRGDMKLDEPEFIVTAESPLSMTADVSPVTGRVVRAVKVSKGSAADPEAMTLYLPNVTVWLERGRRGLEVVDLDEHYFGMVPIVRFVNKGTAAGANGDSEITHTCRSLIDSNVRTLLGLEVHREFFSSPTRYILGADPELFTDEDGKPIPAWEAYIGKILALQGEDTESGDKQLPQVGQFSVQSPTAYTEILESYSRQYAAEAAVPVAYFGLVQDQPSSADAIRMAESRTIRRAEGRHKSFGRAYRELARLLLAFKGFDTSTRDVSIMWRNPATISFAAQVDGVVKLVSCNVIPSTSTIIPWLLDLDSGQRRKLAEEQAAYEAEQRGMAYLAGLGVAAESARTDPAVNEANTTNPSAVETASEDGEAA